VGGPVIPPAVWSFQAAALALAWVAIAVVALAVAGLIREVRELRAVLVDGFGVSFLTGEVPPALRPAAGKTDAIVLAAEQGTVSPDLLAAFAGAARAAAGSDFKVLVGDIRFKAEPSPAGVTAVADPRAFQCLRLPWYPALVHVGADGALSDAAPVGSVEALEHTLRRFGAAGSATPAKGK
jgi:hypothetical protein